MRLSPSAFTLKWLCQKSTNTSRSCQRLCTARIVVAQATAVRKNVRSCPAKAFSTTFQCCSIGSASTASERSSSTSASGVLLEYFRRICVDAIRWAQSSSTGGLSCWASQPSAPTLARLWSSASLGPKASLFKRMRGSTSKAMYASTPRAVQSYYDARRSIVPSGGNNRAYGFLTGTPVPRSAVPDQQAVRQQAKDAGDAHGRGHGRDRAVEGLADHGAEDGAQPELHDAYQRRGGAGHVRIALQRHRHGVGPNQADGGDLRGETQQERPHANGAVARLDEAHDQRRRSGDRRHDHRVAQDLAGAEHRRELGMEQAAQGHEHDHAAEDQAVVARCDAVALDEHKG